MRDSSTVSTPSVITPLEKLVDSTLAERRMFGLINPSSQGFIEFYNIPGENGWATQITAIHAKVALDDAIAHR
jgi:hypothetical protein